MKITDYNQVKELVAMCLDETMYSFSEDIPDEWVIVAVTMAYLSNDTAKATTIDLPNDGSIVYFKRGCSFIKDGAASSYKMQDNICQFEELQWDIEALLLCLDVAYDKWTYNVE